MSRILGAWAGLVLARSGWPVKGALLAALLCLIVPAAHAAGRSIGNCYNGTTITVPAPDRGIVDLSPYGYSICTLTVSGATIYSRYGGAIISITGDNNRLEAEHHGWGLGHGRFQIIGNNNYVALGFSGGNIDINGTGNVFNVWDTFAVEHLRCSGMYPACGNKWVVQGRGGDFVWGGNPHQGVQGLPNHDIFDLVMPLSAAGCGYGCDPTTVSHYVDCMGCRPRPVDGPGDHIYDIPTLKGANGPVVYFIDCSNRSNTLARFLANYTILPGPTPEKWPAEEPAEPIPPWPGGLVPNDIHVVQYGGFNFAANPGRSGWPLNAAPVIFDAWAYANNADVTVTVSVERGLLSRTHTATVTRTGKQRDVNEWIVSQGYIPPAFGTTDTMRFTVTNTGGGATTVTFPITIAQGSVCP